MESVPQELIDVRPIVRNMRPQGYMMQTGGSATRKVVLAEGTKLNPMFRITGVPRHTHNASALLVIDVDGTNPLREPVDRVVSLAEEFSVDPVLLEAGDRIEARFGPTDREEILKSCNRLIEFGVGSIEIKPENCVNNVIAPTRTVAEIRTLVSPEESRNCCTYIDETSIVQDRKGISVTDNIPKIIRVPIVPVNNLHVQSNVCMELPGANKSSLNIEFKLEDDFTKTKRTDLGSVWKVGTGANGTLSGGEIAETHFRAVATIGLPSATGEALAPQIMNQATGEFEDWDGTIELEYNEDNDTYEPRYQSTVVRFWKDLVFFTSKAQFDEKRLVAHANKQFMNVRQDEDYVNLVIMHWDDLRTTPEHLATNREGYYVFHRQDDRSLFRDPGNRFATPMVILRAQFRNDPAAFDEAGVDDIYKDNFDSKNVFFMSPGARWPVGTDLALPGPLFSMHYFDGDDGTEPTAGEYAYATPWRSLKKIENPFDMLKAIDGIDAASKIEPYLNFMPSSATTIVHTAQGTAENVAATTLAIARSWPVPFSSGFGPFKNDYRSPHPPGLSPRTVVGNLLIGIPIGATPHINLPGVAQPGETFESISRIKVAVQLVIADAQNATATKTYSDAFISTGDLYSIAIASAGPDDGTQESYDRRVFDNSIGYRNMCAVVPVASLFESTAANIFSVPYFYMGSRIHNYEAGETALHRYDTWETRFDQQALFNATRPRSIDWFRGTSVNFAGMAQALRTAADYLPSQKTQLPTIGNIFAIGPDGSATPGTIENKNEANARLIETSVEIDTHAELWEYTRFKGLHRGEITIRGLMVEPLLLRERTILFFYGDNPKQLFIYDPEMYGERDFPITLPGEGAGAPGRKQKTIGTTFPVASYSAVVNSGPTDCEDGTVDSHIYIAVLALRSQGIFDDPILQAYLKASKSSGNIFESKLSVSQYLTAPMITPDYRSGCTEPLDQTSAFLPPEMRDFTITLRDLDWSAITDMADVNVRHLIFSEFNGGNQQPAAIPSLLSVPEFRLSTEVLPIGSRSFDIELFTPQGPPAFWVIYARETEMKTRQGGQPRIEQLSMRCLTTGKKSDTIHETSENELYFMTQRNTHPRANYDSSKFASHQTILLRSEDVGTMGLSPHMYQREKRTRYRVHGTLSEKPSSMLRTVFVVLVYNNRGLQIQGKEISLQYV